MAFILFNASVDKGFKRKICRSKNGISKYSLYHSSLECKHSSSNVIEISFIDTSDHKQGYTNSSQKARKAKKNEVIQMNKNNGVYLYFHLKTTHKKCLFPVEVTNHYPQPGNKLHQNSTTFPRCTIFISTPHHTRGFRNIFPCMVYLIK